MNWIYVMEEEDLAEGNILPVYPLGVNVVVARVEGTIYAVSGKCQHLGSALFTGKLDGFTLTCRCHDWRFDIRTGRFLDAPELGLAVYLTKSEAGKLYIRME